MDEDQSFGIIPLRRVNGEWETLLIQNRNGGHWGFPKGHAEPNETPKQAAEREFFEETGLSIKRFIPAESLIESYELTARGKIIFKTVSFFLAEVEGEITLQNVEILASQWIPLSEAYKQITFSGAKELSKKALAFLQQ